MKFGITLSALIHLLMISSAALADVTNNVPTTVSGGSGTVIAIQSDDGTFYTATKGDTVNIGGFTAVGGDISSVVLHVNFSVNSGGYTGTNPIQVNGVNTSIIPTNGDTQRTASVDITSGAFRVNTWPEITALTVSFINNDSGSGQSVLFDHAYLVITHTARLFAPPTWSDEFDDSGPPNPAFWTFEQGFVRNSELQWYQSNNAWQQGGNLIIEGRREQVTNPNYVAGSSDWRTNRQFAQYTSSSIISQGKYSFKYGRMQVRAKIPCFPGSWPAIWTIGNTGEWPSCGEIDILEYYAPDSVLANIAKGSSTRWSATWFGQKTAVSPFFTAANPNWRTEYHVWTMQWDEQNIRLYIDNHLMKSVPQTSLINPVTTWGPREPFKQPHFLLLNLALGGAGGPISSNPTISPFPMKYELDYVRVWEGLTGNNAPTDIALANDTIPPGLPSGTVVGNLEATDVDAAEVHSFSLVSGTGSTHNSSFEVVFRSDQPKNSVLRTRAVLNSADGDTRSIRVRVTDIEGATFDKVLTVQLQGQFVVEVDPGSLAVPEGGSNTFNVRLRVPPTQTITLDVSRLNGDADLSVTSPSQLTFTPANATVWQTVTLAAAEDADRTNGTATILCNDASGAFLSATVIANELDNEDPPIPAVVTLTNLNQTFDGFMKTVTVTTTVNGVPQNLSYDLTYEGQFMPPADAGSYDVVATITDPDYIGSASGVIVIAKASQTISFGPLGSVLDNSPPLALTGSASSSLPVSYTSSNTNVATVSGNTLTISGPGTTTITATQPGDANRDAAPSVQETLTVLRANPLAVTNGPYLVLSNQSLSLISTGSQPSGGQTITEYSWDLNNNGVFGDVTGATPAAISFAALITTWAMVDGPNPITLRVTDSAGKIATTTTMVEVVVSPTWDSNGIGALQTDGPGDWTTVNQWWNGTSNTDWTSGDDAIFGNGGTGGVVTLASPTTAGSLTFNSFTGTYTLGTSGQTITLNGGITMNAASGAVTILSPLALGSAQSWTNSSAGLLTVGPAAISNNGFLLSVGGTGNTTVSNAIGGAGGLAKSGAGTLSLTGSSSYAGTTTVSGGTLVLSNANTISAATSVAGTGTLQLGHATSMGTSTMTLAGGATLQLRNDANTSFTAPIATAPTTAAIYNFDVNNSGSAVTDRTLSLGDLTFATSTTGTVTNRINITGGNNGYTLGLGTINVPSGGPGVAHPLIINPTTAAVSISRINTGSFGTVLNFNGSNNATLGVYQITSNGIQTLSVNGANVTLGTTVTVGTDRNNSVVQTYTLNSGTLNLTTNTSIANLRSGANPPAPLFNINGGILNNTSGTALNLGGLVTTTNNNPTITLGGNFAFGTPSSTSANNLNLGTGAVTLSNNRTVTVNGATNLTLGGAVGGSFTLTKEGTGTLTLGGQNTFSGNTTINSGTLAIPAAGKLYNSSTTADTIVNAGATLQVHSWAYAAAGSIGNPFFAAANLVIDGGTITYTGVGEDALNNNGRLFTIGANGATLNSAGSGTWLLNRNSTDGDQIIGNGRTLILAGSSNGRYNNVLAGTGVTPGTGGRVTKSGAGTWTLAATNTYNGPTTVSGGTLLVNSPGSLHASSAVTVGTGTGGTLGGNGTINGNVTVAADGSLTPGATVGTLTIGALNISALANGGTGKLNFELDSLANTNDRIAVTGTLTIGVGVLGFSDFVFSNLGGLQITGGTPYTLISSGSITAANTLDPNNLSGILPGGLLGTLQINGNNIELAVTSANTAPTISDIANLSAPSGGNTGAINFTVGDNETDPGLLTVTRNSGNTGLVPDDNIVFGVSGANRTVTVTPVAGLVGSATITIRVTDSGGLFAEDTFVLTVTPNYLSWATVNNVTGGENGDSDNDGVKNLIEYALIDGGERGVLNGYTITFTKRGGDYGSDLTYNIESSTLLTAESWSTLAKPPVVETSDSISYTFNPSSPVKNFARLKVVKVP